MEKIKITVEERMYIDKFGRVTVGVEKYIKLTAGYVKAFTTYSSSKDYIEHEQTYKIEGLTGTYIKDPGNIVDFNMTEYINLNDKDTKVIDELLKAKDVDINTTTEMLEYISNIKTRIAKKIVTIFFNKTITSRKLLDKYLFIIFSNLYDLDTLTADDYYDYDNIKYIYHEIYGYEEETGKKFNSMKKVWYKGEQFEIYSNSYYSSTEDEEKAKQKFIEKYGYDPDERDKQELINSARQSISNLNYNDIFDKE